MAHLNILLTVISLITGSLALYLLSQRTRTNMHPFFKPFFYFILFFNLILIIDATSMYSCINLQPDNLAFKSTAYALIAGRLSSLSAIFMSFFLIRTALVLLNRDLNRGTVRLIAAILTIITLSYALRIILSFYGITIFVMNALQWTLTLFMFTVALALLVILLVRSPLHPALPHRKTALIFSVCYLSVFIWILAWAATRVPGRLLLIPLGSIGFNVMAVCIFSRRLLPKEKGSRSPYLHPSALDRIGGEYNLSKREIEIAELIISGDSNKEIEAKLYISLNTVKNHVYNIYRKLGVNSRSQLIWKIMDMNGENDL